VTLRQGDKGSLVLELQRNLIKLGYDPGKPDGDYGAKTTAAVLAFQLDYTDIGDDGVYGPQSDAKLRKVLNKAPVLPSSSETYVACNDATWVAFQKMVSTITSLPVRYGPGRGLFNDGKFVVTYGPGGLGLKNWKSLVKPTPSFHCSSWTNFFLAWLLRYNERYTHAGNIPDLDDLLTENSDEHVVPMDGWTLRYRGYGEACFKLVPDGSSTARHKMGNYFDARELLARKDALPTFIVCWQSTKTGNVWKWWHHTVLFVAYEGRLYRIAADGYCNAARQWSGRPLVWVEITDKNVGQLDGAIYQAWGVRTADGAYGDPTRPMADVGLEA